MGGIAAAVAGPIVGGLFGSSAADAQAQAAQQASATSAAAANQATQLQREMFQAQQAAQAPYQAVGAQSINALAGLMGISPTVAAPEQQYMGMTRDQLRASLLPQYTSTSPQYTIPQGGSNQLINTALSMQGQQGAFAQQPSVNETALNARIDQILKQQQDYATAQQAQQSPTFGTLNKPFSMADYQADPGYAFRLSEGMKALENSAAARGGLLSGNMMRGAQQFGQDLASQEYQNAYNRYQQNQGNQFNRLAALSGVGQTATGALGQAGQNYATAAGNIGMGSAANQANAALMAGQARASSMQGMGQALGGVNWGNVFGPSSSTYGNAMNTLWG